MSLLDIWYTSRKCWKYSAGVASLAEYFQHNLFLFHLFPAPAAVHEKKPLFTRCGARRGPSCSWFHFCIDSFWRRRKRMKPIHHNVNAIVFLSRLTRKPSYWFWCESDVHKSNWWFKFEQIFNHFLWEGGVGKTEWMNWHWICKWEKHTAVNRLAGEYWKETALTCCRSFPRCGSCFLCCCCWHCRQRNNFQNHQIPIPIPTVLWILQLGYIIDMKHKSWRNW